jgi:hypothetical protein
MLTVISEHPAYCQPLWWPIVSCLWLVTKLRLPGKIVPKNARLFSVRLKPFQMASMSTLMVRLSVEETTPGAQELESILNQALLLSYQNTQVNRQTIMPSYF